MSHAGRHLTFDAARVDALLDQLAQVAAGHAGAPLPISTANDQLDAVAFAINVLVGELRWASERTQRADQRVADELRRARDDAERASEAKSVFLRNVSHEIRTPIAAVLILGDLLGTEGVSDRERSDLVDRLKANGQSLLSLLDNVLDLTKLEAAKVVFTPQPVCPAELVHDVVHSLSAEAQRKGLDVTIDVDGTTPVVLDTDRRRLRQIVENLVTNAIKFTSAGGVRVSVRHATPAGADRVLIDVVDTGIGIDPSRHARLFEPFGQTNVSHVRASGGTGLGLAVSRRLTEELGGTLALHESAPSKGSTFRLTMAARLLRRTATSVPAGTVAAAPDAALHGLRILLAEDNADLRLAVARMLRVLGASVEVAADGREAIDHAIAGPFDVVLMDVWMPNVDGLEATSVLRRAGYRHPIIALSADATTERRAAALEAQCDAYLSKPFDADVLISSIHSLLQRDRNIAAAGQN